MNNNVFTIERAKGTGEMLEYKAMIIEGHSVFNGHFPESPVVPGVCTMSMIKDCLEDTLGRALRYSYIKECKFLAAIIPSEHRILDVTLVLKQESMGNVNVDVEIVSMGVKMMKLKAILV